jgi:hypothetical protein
MSFSTMLPTAAKDLLPWDTLSQIAASQSFYPVCCAVGMATVVPMMLLFCMNGKDGNDKAMLSFRNANAISTYTKFTLAIAESENDRMALVRSKVEELLGVDTLLNAIPGRKTFTRRCVDDVVHVVDKEPHFSDVDTAFPVKVYLSSRTNVVWIFVDHAIADGLGMYNDVIAPILDNPRFTLAKRPIYYPGLLEMHQIYVLTRLVYLYMTASAPLARMPKEQQYAVSHELELREVKKIAKANNIPTTALIIGVLVHHFRKSLTVQRKCLRICVSYAFQRGESYNNYSFILLKCRASDNILQTARSVSKQIYKGRRQINTMYYLLQKTGLPQFLDVQSMIKNSLCDCYIAATYVPDSGEGFTNCISSCLSEHFSISTGVNMTAMSIGEKICVSTKVGLKDISQKTFADEMVMES